MPRPTAAVGAGEQAEPQTRDGAEHGEWRVLYSLRVLQVTGVVVGNGHLHLVPHFRQADFREQLAYITHA